MTLSALRAWSDERGSATIETVLMFPLIIAFLSLAVDLSLIFNSRAEVLRVMQQANRSASIGTLDNTHDVETFVETNVSHLSANASATTSIAAGVISTRVTVPASDLMMTGIFTHILGVQLTLHAQQMIENWEA